MTSGGNRDFDQRKFEELILYIALKSERSEWYGRTKLIKLLFFSDFEAFRRLGHSITGATYRKLEHGPAPMQFLETVRTLTKSQSAIERNVRVFQYDQKQLLALREADLGRFTGEEIAIVDEVILRFWKMNATELSDLTHRLPGWRLAEPKEVIPYETVILPERQRDLTPEELAWAKESLAKLSGK